MKANFPMHFLNKEIASASVFRTLNTRGTPEIIFSFQGTHAYKSYYFYVVYFVNHDLSGTSSDFSRNPI